MAEMASLLFGDVRERTAPLATANIRRMPGVSSTHFPVRGRTSFSGGPPDPLFEFVHAFDGRRHLPRQAACRTCRVERRRAIRIGPRAARDVLLRPRLAVDVPRGRARRAAVIRATQPPAGGGPRCA